MLRVAVIGANGSMGRLTCQAVRDAEGLDLAAEIDAGDSWDPVADADVAVHFTHPGVVMDHLAWCLQHGVHSVVGTSGFTDERLETLAGDMARDVADHGGTGVVVVPNFSIGATLMMQYAAAAAGFFESVEIVEMHHPNKADAPSGTALRTAQMVARERADAGAGPMPDATRSDELGTRGGEVSGVHVHSLRARGLVAHQEVLLGNPGETLTIRHDMPDRVAAMPGVVASVRYVVDHPGLTVGLEQVLGLGAAG